MNLIEVDRAGLVFARTHGHSPSAERLVGAFSRTGEHAAIWFALGLAGAAMSAEDPAKRRAWLRGRENLRKRYLVHVAGYNLGLIMRLLVGAGTPREFLARAAMHLLAAATVEGAVLVALVITTGTEAAMLAVSFRPEPPG